jgi:hypothetical protein
MLHFAQPKKTMSTMPSEIFNSFKNNPLSIHISKEAHGQNGSLSLRKEAENIDNNTSAAKNAPY